MALKRKVGRTITKWGNVYKATVNAWDRIYFHRSKELADFHGSERINLIKIKFKIDNGIEHIVPGSMEIVE